MAKAAKTLLIWVVLFVAFILLWNVVGSDDDVPVRDWAAVEKDLDEGRLVGLEFEPESSEVTIWTTETTYRVFGYPSSELSGDLAEAGIALEIAEASDWFSSLFWTLIVVVAVLGLFLYFLKRMGGASGGNLLELRKVKARPLAEEVTVAFDRVGGCEEAKNHLRDVIEFLADPSAWAAIGARVPRGVLLEGPPGCGKTLLARAVAGEVKASFYFISASEFVEMFVGVGAARVRDLFETASASAPAVIFVDELDAVGRRRGSGLGAAHDEREQTLNQLLVCLDGLETSGDVVVIAATNRHDILDPALLRPGRFDRRVRVPLPDVDARREILGIHGRDKPFEEGIDPAALAEETEGLTGADLETLMNDAALLAVRRYRREGGEVQIGHADLTEALKMQRERAPSFDRLDQLLVESTTQLAEAAGTIRARLVLGDGHEIEGTVLWADATFVKLATDGDGDRIVPKSQVRSLLSLGGSEPLRSEELRPDPWAGHRPGLA